MMHNAGQRYPVGRRIEQGCIRLLKRMVYALLYLSGAAVLLMIAVTCADVVLRLPWINRPFIGAYDIVRNRRRHRTGRGIALYPRRQRPRRIEYFFHKLNRTSRIGVDSLLRLLSMVLVAVLGWRSILYGLELHRTSQVSQTLKLPIFWLPMVIGFCCFIVVLVVAHHLLYPRREMIKP
jgi:TRAP-type C4-dicarboxylate transport system permease small subunit